MLPMGRTGSCLGAAWSGPGGLKGGKGSCSFGCLHVCVGESLCSLRFAAKVSGCETGAKGGARRHVITGDGSAEPGTGWGASCVLQIPPPHCTHQHAGAAAMHQGRQAACARAGSRQRGLPAPARTCAPCAM